VWFDIPVAKIRHVVQRLLEGGFDHLGDTARGVAFWQDIWRAIRLEEPPPEPVPRTVGMGGGPQQPARRRAPRAGGASGDPGTAPGGTP
jgi:hypothetical protein